MHYAIINDVQTFLGFVILLPDDDYRIAIKIFMYPRPILCTLYCAVDFLNVLKKYIMYL